MQYRELGKTGLKVAPIGFGASPLGGVYGSLDANEGIRSVHVAIERGVNLFDTSPYYGDTRSEAFLGKALQGAWRSKIILSSKAGRIAQSTFDFSPSHMEQSLDESLDRLKTDYLDIFIAHDIEFAGDFDRIWTETVPAMERLKQKGKCRFIGVSGLPLGLLAEAAVKAPIDLVLSYCHFNLLDHTLKDRLAPIVKERGLGLINASPLAMGLLSKSGPPAWHPAPDSIQTAARRAADYCSGWNVDIATIAVQFSVLDPAIPVTLIGMKTASEVEQNLAALDATVQSELLEEVRSILAPVQGKTWPSGNWPLEADLIAK